MNKRKEKAFSQFSVIITPSGFRGG